MSSPARRAVLRWAWRLFRREWRQQLLMLSLLAVAVAGAVALASMASSAASKREGEFGAGNAVARVEVTTPEAEQRIISAATRRFGAVEVVRHLSAAVPGSVRVLDLRAQDPAGALGHPMLALRKGRYPRAEAEVALTDGAADLLGADVGDRVELGGVTRTVVGRVENPGNLDDEFGLLSASDPTPAQSLTILLPADRPSQPRPSGPTAPPAGGGNDDGVSFGILAAGNDHAAVATLVLAVTTVGMALVALVATAGFVVVAQRRQRQLGLLAALGATAGQQRLVLLANGVFVGVASAVVGTAIGVAGWIAAVPAVERAAGHRLHALALPWGLIGGVMGLALLASVGASWWPARTQARQPVMAALARRPAPPSAVHRSALSGIGLLALGLGAIEAAHPTALHVRPLFLIGGLAAVIVGVVLLAPVAIKATLRPAGRLPFTARLAFRDLGRYQARASAALAAITLGLGIAVALVVAANANEPRATEGNLSDRQLLVQLSGSGPSAVRDPTIDAAGRDRLDTTAGRIADVVGATSRVPLDVAVNLHADAAAGRAPISAARPTDHGFTFVATTYVATPALLAKLGIDPATIAPTTDLVTRTLGAVVVLDPTSRPTLQAPDSVQHVRLSRYSSAPGSLLTEAALQRHGWAAMRNAWLLETSTALTSRQLQEARRVAGDAGLAIEARDTHDDLATLRTTATAAGAALALAIIAMTIGLLRGESAGDLRTLTATGAGPRTRRSLSATTAGVLAALGVLLGAAGAYAALVAAYHAQLWRLTSPPVLELVVIGLGVPVLAAATGWALAGRDPPTFSRQLLD